MYMYHFKMYWSFDGQQEEHMLNIYSRASGENEAFTKSAVKAMNFLESKGAAHIIELTYMTKQEV